MVSISAEKSNMAVHKTDIELWEEILHNRPESWKELVSRYQRLVYAVATRSGLSLADAADCFQQTWVLLYQNRRKLKDPSRISAWLVTTAKREAMRLSRLAEKDSGGDVNPEEPDPSPLPDVALERLECQIHLELALKQIDPRCRRILEEFFYAAEEESYEEIARKLGLAPNSLGPIRRRCLEKLKEILISNGYLRERKTD
jgi:RNA polymerase sigma factor (sigma-70 family)